MTDRPAHTSSGTLQVALVAAYPAVRAGLRALLTEDAQIQVTAESPTLHELLAEDIASIDVAVIDLDRDRFGQATRDLITLPSNIGLVLLGPDADENQLPDALAGRPWAYLLKEAGSIELMRAVEAVAAGLVVIQPPLTRRLLAPARAQAIDESPGESLTAREHEVLQLVAQGLPNKVIALRLAISEHTVKFHITSILAKLDASSRTEAVRLGARRGLIVL